MRVNAWLAVPIMAVSFLAGWLSVPEEPKLVAVGATVALDDMRAIVTALEPYEKGGSWQRASVCVRSRATDKYDDAGTVGIEFHASRDAKFIGWGADIPSAVASLLVLSNTARDVLGPWGKKP